MKAHQLYSNCLLALMFTMNLPAQADGRSVGLSPWGKHDEIGRLNFIMAEFCVVILL